MLRESALCSPVSIDALGVVEDAVLPLHRGRGNISGVIMTDPLCSLTKTNSAHESCQRISAVVYIFFVCWLKRKSLFLVARQTFQRPYLHVCFCGAEVVQL